MNFPAENTSKSQYGRSSRKPTPHKGLRLKYPIYGRVASVSRFCPSPVRVRYYLVCGVDLDLENANGLVSQFEFYITHWFREEKHRERVSAKKYRASINMILANLRYAQLEGRQLLTPTRKEATTHENPEKIGYQTVTLTLEYLEAKGFINLVRGRASDMEGACTWCEPLAPLVAIFERRNIQALLHKQTSLVELRIKSKEAGSTPISIPKRQKPKAKKLSAPALAYNKVWLSHMPTLDDKYIVPWCRRIFNDTLDFGGRFYGSFQQLPKLDRARMLIDGEPTIEPDYTALHTNILYAWCNRQLVGDPYDIEGYTRATIKAVMLPLLNTQNIPNLIGQITKSAKPETKAAFSEWQDLNKDYRRHLAQGIRYKPKQKPSYLNGFINGIPTGTDGKKLIEAIREKHPVIAHHFGTANIGVRLQKQDSDIMGAVLQTLAIHDIPALPVHDSLRCKIYNQIMVVETMKSEYLNKTGFTINVDWGNENSSTQQGQFIQEKYRNLGNTMGRKK